MTIPINVKTLLSGDVTEWTRIEFEESWDAEISLKSVHAFANDLNNWGGGHTVIGVEENEGRPAYLLKGISMDKIDACQESILVKCKLTWPAHIPIIEVVDHKNKKFIIIWCPGGNSRLYPRPETITKDNEERIHYIRKTSNTVEPSDDEEKDLFNLANRIPFNDRVNHQAEISGLNTTPIQNYLRVIRSLLYEKSRTEDLIEICSNMNIISNLPKYTRPKNVGLMSFSMEPDEFFLYTQIDVVQFPEGLEGGNIIEQIFRGSIQRQPRDVLQYIRNIIITGEAVEHPDRAEADRFLNHPFAATEEVLSNAVYHRIYDGRESTEVRVKTGRMKALSFPGPDRSITMEGSKSYCVSSRRCRNHRVRNFPEGLHLTEGRNIGFEKILGILETDGSPKLEFETNEVYSHFITRLFIHEGFGDAKHENKHVSTSNSTPPTPNPTSLPEDLQELSLREQILVFIKKNPSTSKKK